MKNLTFGYAYAFIASTCYGILVFGGKLMELAGLSLAEILIIPNSLITLVLTYAAWKRRNEMAVIPLRLYITYMLALLLIQIGQYAPLFMGVSVSITLFCLYTQPVWNILLGKVFLKNRISAAETLITLLILAGLTLLLAPWREAAYSFWGIALAITGGLAMAGWVLMTSRLSELQVSPVVQTFIGNLILSLPFILAYPLFVKLFPAPEISAISLHTAGIWAAVAGYALIIMILAPMLFYKASQSVKALHLGLILLLEPVVGTGLDTTFLGTPLTWNIITGGFLILAANITLIWKNTKKTD